MQNYPSNYTDVNKSLSLISKKLNIPLVDNNKIFNELIQANGRDNYLDGDEHCTPLGYKIMANNVKLKITDLLAD